MPRQLPAISRGDKGLPPVTPISAPACLGFLTILHEATGFLGGYLVTNLWGRPLEFRLSTAVQPNRVQQILYGPTLTEYLHAELIGKTLVEKTSTAATIIVTDRQPVLELRNFQATPVVWVVPAEETEPSGIVTVRAAGDGQPALATLKRYADDLPIVRDVLHRLDSHFDMNEPFARIREAIVEARKLGVTRHAG